jgi:ABC-type bacteriocin/lantibiotic exporter with double-glycine peptidase domain
MPHVELNVPYYSQEYHWTCGPACLRMALAYYLIAVGEEELEKRCGTTVFGTNFEGIMKAAGTFGLGSQKINAVRIEEITGYLELGCPIIARVNAELLSSMHTAKSHAILIVGSRENKLVCHDPDSNFGGENRAIGWTEFYDAGKEFKNEAVVIEPPIEPRIAVVTIYETKWT